MCIRICWDSFTDLEVVVKINGDVEDIVIFSLMVSLFFAYSNFPIQEEYFTS